MTRLSTKAPLPVDALDRIILKSGAHENYERGVCVMEIPLSNGGLTLVDSADYERVARHVWHRDTSGYARAMVKDGGRWRLVRLHRFLLGLRGPHVDHADRDKLNNTRANLRPCTPRQNVANQPKRSGLSSRFKGVTWNRNAGKWLAQIKLDGKYVYLGLFTDEEAAARVYADRAQQHHGEFARVS